jgi:hypothetical protein
MGGRKQGKLHVKFVTEKESYTSISQTPEIVV